MTREERLVFCKKCTNRKMDLKTGLLCGLAGEKAAFEGECSSFDLDESALPKPDVIEAVAHDHAMAVLSEEKIEVLKSEQNYGAALITGIVVGLVGAFLWGIITVATGYQIGYMAIAIGAGVGFSMRFAGKGIDLIFGITGGAIALLSCLLGNFFSIVGFVANAEGLGYLETFSLIDYGMIPTIMGETFSPMDIFFYGIAAFEGYKFAFRKFTERDIAN